MTPSDEDRLNRIRAVIDRALRYYATAYLATDKEQEHIVPDRTLLHSKLLELANVMALLDGDELDDRSMMKDRHSIVDRYLARAEVDPWTPPDQPTH